MRKTLAFMLASTALVTASLAALSRASAFANANAGSKLYICATPQETDLSPVQFAALAWIEIKAVGSHGEAGSSTNILTYDTWDTAVIQKAKGMTDAGSPEIEVARIPDDPGQMAMRAAALDNKNYAFRMMRNDQAVAGGTPTIIYNRGLVTGPKRPFGRNEDFDLEVFTLGLNQVETVINPTLGGNPPKYTAAPAITGTPKVGTVLTVSNGTATGDATITYAYQWFAGGVAVPGVTTNTYTPDVAKVGLVIQALVTASNTKGSASMMSAPTAVVAA